MVVQNGKTDPGPDDSVSEPSGPGQGPMSPGWIIAVALYLVFSSVLVLYGLLKLWPHPTPSGEPKVEAQASASPAASGSTASPTPSPSVARLAPASSPPVSQASSPTPTTPNPTPTSSPVLAVAASPSPTPSGKAKLPDPELIYFFNGWFKANIYAETRLLLLVMLAGALGSLMHSLRSLYWYTGNRMMVWSWVGFYLLLPFTGAILSVIFYFVVRGGFFSPQASFENTSPFGFAALSALVGLFSPQATLKLKEVAETIFTKPESGADASTQGSSGSHADNEADNHRSAPLNGQDAATSNGDVDAIDGCDVDIIDATPDEDLPPTEGGVA
jgi:hypothetical protein